MFQWTPHAYIGKLLKLHPDFQSWMSEFPGDNSKKSPVDVNKAHGASLEVDGDQIRA